MAAPTFVTSATPAFSTSATKTVSVTSQVGDIIVVCCVCKYAGNTDSLATPSGNGLTYTLQASQSNTAGVAVGIWTAIDTVGGTGWTLTMAKATGTTVWGGSYLQFRDSAGIGSVNSANLSGDVPGVNLSSVDANSALVFLSEDTTNASGTVTWRTINGITPISGNGQIFATSVGTFKVYNAYWGDAGAAGAKSPGMLSPDPQDYFAAAVEIKGTAGPTPATLAWMVA